MAALSQQVPIPTIDISTYYPGMDDPIQYADEFESEVTFQYSALGSPDEIRLLHIWPGENRDVVQCQLASVTLEPSDNSHSNRNQQPEYEAMSYTWGPPVLHSICCNGASLAISENLWLALQYLRNTHTQRTFWIDAICINQADLVEKSKQISRMERIYSCATVVTVWLGEAT
jgi:hypothetical protein